VCARGEASQWCPHFELPGIPLWQRGTEGVDRTAVGFAFALPKLHLGSAATTKRGPPRTEMDSPVCGNETPRAGTGACPYTVRGFGPAVVCRHPVILRFLHGCAEGRSHFAEGLGVSPNSLLFFPHEWGTKRVDDPKRGILRLSADFRLRGDNGTRAGTPTRIIEEIIANQASFI
jgi:hypothetical protein